MRKFLSVCAACVLLLSFVTSAAADEPTSASISRTEDRIYFAVTANQEIQAGAMSILYEYDEQVLKAIPEECIWVAKGVLQDFSKDNPIGVWASESAKLSGDLCILSFAIMPGANPEGSQIACTLKVKNSGSEDLACELSATVSVQKCDHQVAAWESVDEGCHKGVCSLCEEIYYQNHEWDSTGKKCTLCGYQLKDNSTNRFPNPGSGSGNSSHIPGEVSSQNPNYTEPTYTMPQYSDTHQYTFPTAPQDHQNVGPTNPSGSAQLDTEIDQQSVANVPGYYHIDEDGNSHFVPYSDEYYVGEDGNIHYSDETNHGQIPEGIETVLPSYHDHDHEHEHEQELVVEPESMASKVALLVSVVLAAAGVITAGVYIALKKKR